MKLRNAIDYSLFNPVLLPTRLYSVVGSPIFATDKINSIHGKIIGALRFLISSNTKITFKWNLTCTKMAGENARHRVCQESFKTMPTFYSRNLKQHCTLEARKAILFLAHSYQIFATIALSIAQDVQ